MTLNRVWRIGLLCLLVVSLVSTYFAYDSWKVNPGGIFHQADTGTNWGLVWETFFSWFWPLLPAVLAPALILFWILSRNRKR